MRLDVLQLYRLIFQFIIYYYHFFFVIDFWRVLVWCWSVHLVVGGPGFDYLVESEQGT